MERSALCRSRRELSNADLLAKFGFDTAENEPAKIWPIAARRWASSARSGGFPGGGTCGRFHLRGGAESGSFRREIEEATAKEINIESARPPAKLAQFTVF